MNGCPRFLDTVQFRACIRGLRALFVFPADNMESQALKTLCKAQKSLNGGRQGKGVAGSKIASFSAVYNNTSMHRDGLICPKQKIFLLLIEWIDTYTSPIKAVIAFATLWAEESWAKVQNSPWKVGVSNKSPGK